jgi:subtilisin family serine protease
LGYQTGLKNGNTGRDIHATQAWDYNTGRSDVKIAVIDAGVDYNHIDLDPGNRSRVIAGYDAADDDNNPFDDIPSQYDAASHGTSVAGVIGAITNNDEGVAGIMHSLQIVPVKVFATTGPWWILFLDCWFCV